MCSDVQGSGQDGILRSDIAMTCSQFHQHFMSSFSWGQFHQSSGAKLECASTYSLAPAVIPLCCSVSPTKLRRTLPLRQTIKYAQFLRCTLYPSCMQVSSE